MAESGGDERIGGCRRLKAEEKVDRLSALPDSLIHHILSFLPSTKQAIQTSILSKRWLNQWTFVSNLYFDFSGMFSNSDYSRENTPLTTYAITRIMNQTLFLHQCPKLHKFQITTDQFYRDEYDPNFEDKIRFVVRKQVEELILNFSDRKHFRLPELFFFQPCLVKLQLFKCSIMPTGMVNWKSLKDLYIVKCSCSCEVIRSIVSGCPLLQSLQVYCRLYGTVRLVINSESLKRLALKIFGFKGQILKEIEISCPHLEELGLFGWIETIRLMNLSSLVRAYLGCKTTAVKQILESVQHLSELNIGNSFLESLSDLEMDAISHSLLKCKSLTLEGSHGLIDLVHIPGIAYALRSSPLLERLVVKLRPFKCLHLDLSGLDHPEESYWNSNGTHLSSLVSHLRTVKITGFSRSLYKPKLVLDFIAFLLKNAPVLEKMVVILVECGTDFESKVSQKLESFPRCSAAIVELACPSSSGCPNVWECLSES